MTVPYASAEVGALHPGSTNVIPDDNHFHPNGPIHSAVPHRLPAGRRMARPANRRTRHPCSVWPYLLTFSWSSTGTLPGAAASGASCRLELRRLDTTTAATMTITATSAMTMRSVGLASCPCE